MRAVFQPTQSNRFEYIDREHLSGAIGGTFFGYHLSCVARTPTHAILWSGGTAYWSGRGQTSYGSSTLYVYKRERVEGIRDAVNGGSTRIGEHGGRLNMARMTDADWDRIAELLGEDFRAEIGLAIQHRKTLLIEGGGKPFLLKGQW